jgi:DNA primase
MADDLQLLKRQASLLAYLRKHDWVARPVGSNQEFVGLCPLHAESRPSFYVNEGKNVFYCHGCGRGGDVIRFVQIYLNLSFHQSVAHLKQEFSWHEPSSDGVLEAAVAFYERQLYCHPEALDYLQRRGLVDRKLMRQLKLGYAGGGSLRRHLIEQGYSSDLLTQVGLISRQGRDTFYKRIVFPCFDHNRVINLYGRSIVQAAPHRFLARPKGGLFEWAILRSYASVIVVEGLFDLAALWQEGLVNTTCGYGSHLTAIQVSQLCEPPGREVMIAFDSDRNAAGQSAARLLAERLRSAGVLARIVEFPDGHDPNSYFRAGANAEDFRRLTECAKDFQP